MVFSVIIAIAVFAFIFYAIPKGRTISSRGTSSGFKTWWPHSASMGPSTSWNNFKSGSGSFGGNTGSGKFGGFGGGSFGGGGASGSW